MGVVVDTCPKADSPSLPTPTVNNQGAGNFTDGGRGAHAETAQSALTVTEIGRRWSDQPHLDCFRYSCKLQGRV